MPKEIINPKDSRPEESKEEMLEKLFSMVRMPGEENDSEIEEKKEKESRSLKRIKEMENTLSSCLDALLKVFSGQNEAKKARAKSIAQMVFRSLLEEAQGIQKRAQANGQDELLKKVAKLMERMNKVLVTLDKYNK